MRKNHISNAHRRMYKNGNKENIPEDVLKLLEAEDSGTKTKSKAKKAKKAEKVEKFEFKKDDQACKEC